MDPNWPQPMQHSLKILTLAALLLSSVAISREVPKLPEPNGNQFAVELFKIETPYPFDQNKFNQGAKAFEEMFISEESVVSAHPVMYAKVGEMVENDQTEEALFPKDYNVVNGKPVPVNKLQHLGTRTRVTLNSATQTSATFHIDFHHQVLKGYDTYKLGNNIEVKMPIFETRKVNTEVTQPLNSWIVVGGIESKKKEKIKTAYYIIRISKPGNGRRY